MPKLSFLGTGSSAGVPELLCTCRICQKAKDVHSPHHRFRCAILVAHQNKNILIDPSQDLRLQFLQNNVLAIDAVLLTHAHEDHCGGIPELRMFAGTHMNTKPLPFFLREHDFLELQKRFHYIFNPNIPTTKPKLAFRVIKPLESFGLAGLTITPFPTKHPPANAWGYKINDLAYAPDLKELPFESKLLLQGISTLIVGANSDKAYPNHQSIFESLALAKELNAKRVFLTHIGHRIERLDLANILPENTMLARDRLQIDF